MQKQLLLICISVLFGMLTTPTFARNFEFWISYDVNYVDAHSKVKKHWNEELKRAKKEADSVDDTGSIRPVPVVRPCDFVMIEYDALNLGDYFVLEKSKSRHPLKVKVPLGEFCSFRNYVFDSSNKALMIVERESGEPVLHDYENLLSDEDGKLYVSSEEFIDKYGFESLKKNINSSKECIKTFEKINNILRRERIDDVVHVEESMICPKTGVYVEDIARTVNATP